MGLGGPVWHASAAKVGRRPHKLELRSQALIALAGVGDKAAGEWHEWSGHAYHVRRRLTAAEQMVVGPVLDCRGTEEFRRRYEAVVDLLPPQALALAREEGRLA